MKKSGFTILETVVAVTLLATVILGVTQAMQTGISSYILSKEQVTAVYLAQESFEQMRHMRDQNVLANSSWLTGISGVSTDPCYFGNNCYNDTLNGTLTRCTSGCPVIRQQPSTKLYGYTPTWDVTPFQRTIRLASVNAHEFAMTVTISWAKGSVSKQLVLRENFFTLP